MSIFKKRDLSQISDDYYNAYKEDLKAREKRKSFISLNTIIKFEFFTLVAGLVFMSYNNFFSNFSIEFPTNISTSTLMLSQENSIKSKDALLVEQLRLAEVDRILPIEIKEEDVVEKQVTLLSKKLNINATDMTLLVEIIKSQLTKPSSEAKEDKVIISQI
jgi:hypothetical protein